MPQTIGTDDNDRLERSCNRRCDPLRFGPAHTASSAQPEGATARTTFRGDAPYNEHRLWSGAQESRRDVASSKHSKRSRAHEHHGESGVDDASSTWFAEHRRE